MGLSTPLLRGEDRVSGARGESCCQMRPSQRQSEQSEASPSVRRREESRGQGAVRGWGTQAAGAGHSGHPGLQYTPAISVCTVSVSSECCYITVSAE